MNKISLCMIVKNEEDTLERCLNSIFLFVDEIIIIDTGSTDKTKKIAEKFTDKVFDFVWIDDFSAARNFAFSKARMDYIMWLDSDDVILEKDQKIFLELKNSLTGTEKEIVCKYNVGFDENGNVNFSYYRERIFLRNIGLKWMGQIHEVIPILPDAKYSEFAVTHSKIHPTEQGRNLRIFEKMMKDGIELDTRQKFYFARELYYNDRIEEAIKKFQIFLEDQNGWVENKISTCKDLCDCYKKIGQKEKGLEVLLSSFKYSIPTAEICCEIGFYFLEAGKYEVAVFWYLRALESSMDIESGGFRMLDCYGYIPCIQLCVCYDKLNNFEESFKYNEKAAFYKPDSKLVQYNRNYFKSIYKEIN